MALYSELSEKIGQLKMSAEDGKMRITDVADTEQLFRIIQSVPSPKAEPFKLWLAKVARERLDEIEDPEIGIDRLMETYLRKGYTKDNCGCKPQVPSSLHFTALETDYQSSIQQEKPDRKASGPFFFTNEGKIGKRFLTL